MKKPAIPTPPSGDKARMSFDAAIKERLEIIGGERGGKRIRQLNSEASQSEVIAKVNELLERLQ